VTAKPASRRAPMLFSAKSSFGVPDFTSAPSGASTTISLLSAEMRDRIKKHVKGEIRYESQVQRRVAACGMYWSSVRQAAGDSFTSKHLHPCLAGFSRLKPNST